jgi:hypothetical protein
MNIIFKNTFIVCGTLYVLNAKACGDNDELEMAFIIKGFDYT